MFFFGIGEEGQEVECWAKSRRGKASLPGPGVGEANLGGGSCGEERGCGPAGGALGPREIDYPNRLSYLSHDLQRAAYLLC